MIAFLAGAITAGIVYVIFVIIRLHIAAISQDEWHS